MTTENTTESWAIVELMGHVAMAGRVTKPGEYGGLWQIDIPNGDSFRTEFFGSQSVYRIRMVSEEIARAYAPRHEVIEYNAPIITRNEHEMVIERYQERINELQRPKLADLLAPECRWERVYSSDFNQWSGGCGFEWIFEDGDLEDNHMNFCPGCGHKVVIVNTGEEIEASWEHEDDGPPF